MAYPTVSIITPTYNRGHLIDNTIQSVLNQTYKNIEYILVDGRSKDKTIDILESYKKRGELTYISMQDEGMYFAINDGLKWRLVRLLLI
jgi:glycosyltransferase involved in cell wall biosynthesis